MDGRADGRTDGLTRRTDRQAGRQAGSQTDRQTAVHGDFTMTRERLAGGVVGRLGLRSAALAARDPNEPSSTHLARSAGQGSIHFHSMGGVEVLSALVLG